MTGVSSPTRDRTHTPCREMPSLDHWTTSEVPVNRFLKTLHVLMGLTLTTAFWRQYCYYPPFYYWEVKEGEEI